MVGIASQTGVWAKAPKIQVPEYGGRGARSQISLRGTKAEFGEDVALKTKGWKKVRWREGQKAGWSHGSSLCGYSHPTGSWMVIRRTRKSGYWWNGRTRKGTDQIFLLRFAAELHTAPPGAGHQIQMEDRTGLSPVERRVGLDHYEGRNWDGWHHHVTIVMMAHAFLTLETSAVKKTSGWTLPRTRREIQYCSSPGQVSAHIAGVPLSLCWSLTLNVVILESSAGSGERSVGYIAVGKYQKREF